MESVEILNLKQPTAMSITESNYKYKTPRLNSASGCRPEGDLERDLDQDKERERDSSISKSKNQSKSKSQSKGKRVSSLSTMSTAETQHKHKNINKISSERPEQNS